MGDLHQRIAQILGTSPVSWQRRSAPWQSAEPPAGGNLRFSVLLENGQRVFVKAARAPDRADALRREAEVYAHLHGSFIAELIAFDDHDDEPVLVLEDLSDAEWSVRWDAPRMAAVRTALAEVAASQPPPNTPPVREMIGELDQWQVVAADPAPFLSTGIRSEDWLRRALPSLRAAADAAPVDGDELLHLDVRSDNLCFRHGAAILIDWDWCSTGRAEFDLAAWLPSLALEGGPAPWEVLPQAGGYAAVLAGFWASVVGLPPPPTGPTVRELQRRQLKVALAWCEHELGLV